VREPARPLGRARALAAAIALVTISACGRGLSPRVDEPTAAAQAPAAPAAAAPAREPSPAAPGSPAPPARAAPGYTLMDLEAIERAVQGRGHPVLVHFWASWCGPCLQELPLVDKFVRDMRARGIEVLSLSLDDAERAGGRVVEVLAARAPNLTRNIVRVQDTSSLINTIDPRWEGSIPAMFAYDSKGRLRDSLIGETTRRDLDVMVSRVADPGRK